MAGVFKELLPGPVLPLALPGEGCCPRTQDLMLRPPGHQGPPPRVFPGSRSDGLYAVPSAWLPGQCGEQPQPVLGVSQKDAGALGDWKELGYLLRFLMVCFCFFPDHVEDCAPYLFFDWFLSLLMTLFWMTLTPSPSLVILIPFLFLGMVAQ